MKQSVASDLPYTQEDLALVPKFIPELSIIRVVLISSRYCRDEAIDANPSMEMNVAFENKVTAFVDAPTKQAWALVDMRCVATPSLPEFKTIIPFEVECRFEVRYLSNQTSIDDKEFQKALNAFLHTVSPSHAWSFFRQHLVDAMGRMLLPPILLPLLISPEFGQGKVAVKEPKNTKSRDKKQ